MSVINKALSELSEKPSGANQPLEKIELKAEKPSGLGIKKSLLLLVLIVLVSGLAVWALIDNSRLASESTVETAAQEIKSNKDRQGTNTELIEVKQTDTTATRLTPPTQKKATVAKVFEADNQSEKSTQNTKGEDSVQVIVQIEDVKTVLPTPVVQADITTEDTSQNSVAPEQDRTVDSAEKEQTQSEFKIEQVQLTPKQLADKSLNLADKALANNQIDEAINHFKTALSHQPRNDFTRQKLSALYYGKSNINGAVELLQTGIQLAPSEENLRIALAKLLMREKQLQAALASLIYLPPQPSVEYLSLRAGIAQQNKQDDLALESYQKLVGLDAENPRWWMGLAIQLERDLQLKQAQQAYSQSLQFSGLSKQSRKFVQDRIAVLAKLQGVSNEN